MIISGFCAIGKTHFLSDKDTLQCDVRMKIYDLDSSAYSSEPGFPHNYVSEIRKLAETPSIILISTHGGVPTQLAKDGYYVALVYPGHGPEAKREWLRRLENRGREQGAQASRLYELTDKNWDLWYERTAGEDVTSRWTLSNDQYLSTIFEDIHADFRKFQTH
jgi:glyoxylase-like metal-dependent hydrolase (beta-lactamase superfamily II)